MSRKKTNKNSRRRTVGFTAETIKECLEHLKNKPEHCSPLWREHILREAQRMQFALDPALLAGLMAEPVLVEKAHAL